MRKATAVAGPNIALVKYWGNRDDRLRLPANPSLSMTLAGLETTTTVAFDSAGRDTVVVDGKPISREGLERVRAVLEPLRRRARAKAAARVVSRNNFPAGAGLASSASGFAALATAAAAALGLGLPPRELSAAARRGSGSAARSVFGGFAELRTDGTAYPLAPPDHWGLRDIVVVLSPEPKGVGSSEGHLRAPTSPLFEARRCFVERILPEVRAALLGRDFPALARLAEADALAMHSVMATSQPPLVYWSPRTLQMLEAVRRWRGSGVACGFTLDAGPNVHILAPAASARRVAAMVGKRFPEARLFVCPPGRGARLTQSHLF